MFINILQKMHKYRYFVSKIGFMSIMYGVERGGCQMYIFYGCTTPLFLANYNRI